MHEAMITKKGDFKIILTKKNMNEWNENLETHGETWRLTGKPGDSRGNLETQGKPGDSRGNH